ncbi:ATP-binding protein [Kitasatospora sp. NPDC048365]|uniref:ATP-binding protein n=1 Tax=Kitasatospora sp. NPDC048365 TaxID=3364050 RepID=UPI00371D416B
MLEPTALAEVIVDLPYRPQSAAQARNAVRRALLGWGLDDLVDDGALVVSELVANAAKTGCHQEMALRITRSTAASVRIAVTDGSRALPVRIKAAGASAESGRGIDLVHRLTRGHWGVEVETFGKTVHADLRRGGTR